VARSLGNPASRIRRHRDASQLTRITVRLLIAATLGGILGFERETKGKAAGCARTCWWHSARRCSCWCRRCPAPGRCHEPGVQGVIAGIGFRRRHHPEKPGRRRRPRQRPDHRRRLVDDRRHRRVRRVGQEATAVFSTVLALVIFSVVPRIVKVFERKNDHL
jgi:putative Mg2+ transporter-C (MgtC) family protein